MPRIPLVPAIVFAFLICSACGEEEWTGSAGPTTGTNTGATGNPTNQTPLTNNIVTTPEREDFSEKIRNEPPITQPAALAQPQQIGPALTNRMDNQLIVTTRYLAAPAFTEQLALDPNSDVLWPGALIEGRSIPDGRYAPLSARRGPLTLSISLANVNGPGHHTVSEARLSSVRQAVGNILSRTVSTPTPAQFSFVSETVQSSTHLDLAVGAHFGSGIHNIRGQFNFQDNRIKSRVLVRFVQVYYTIDIDIPPTPAGFFAPDEDLPALAARLAGSAPVYVSSISYGRMVFFSFESSKTEEELRVAVNYACRTLLAEGGANLSITHRDVLNESTIRVSVIGGNGAGAIQAINGFEQLQAFILAGGNYGPTTPAAPIAFRMRYLADNNLAAIVLAKEYETRRTYPLTRIYTIDNLTLECISEDDPGDEAEFFGWLDLGAHIEGGEKLTGWRNGQSCPTRIFNLPESKCWGMRPGARRAISDPVRFHVPVDRIDRTFLNLVGNLRESDTFGSDNLGTRSWNVRLSEVSDRTYALPDFYDGGTRARITFTIRAD